VTRIIAGVAGGARLDVPDRGTRPTSERVREALFSALESADVLHGSRVLDLYAGSGALGLEALSRGGVSLDLVEKSPPAATVAQRNAQRISRTVGAPAHVHRSAVQTFLRQSSGSYDLVFSDPPYELSDADLAEDLRLLTPLLSKDALVVVERGKRSAEPEWAASGLELVRGRVYGDTAVWWAQPRAASQSE
jgi:16S rRNA (guanine966-N2)-methyltransferase